MARRLLAACLIGMLTMSGCGSSAEEPDPTTSPSPSSPATATTPAAPELPEAAQANTKAGAIAFVRHYIALMNHALVTGDTKTAAEASDDGCGSCQAGNTRVEEIYASGGHVRGGEWALQRVLRAGPNSRIDGWVVTGTVEFGAQTVVEGDPPKTDENKAGSLTINFSVARGEAGWVMLDWKRVQ